MELKTTWLEMRMAVGGEANILFFVCFNADMVNTHCTHSSLNYIEEKLACRQEMENKSSSCSGILLPFPANLSQKPD